jgi:hypothetical protein
MPVAVRLSALNPEPRSEGRREEEGYAWESYWVSGGECESEGGKDSKEGSEME